MKLLAIFEAKKESVKDSAEMKLLKDLAAFDKNVQDRLVALDDLFDTDIGYEFGSLTAQSLKWFYGTADTMPTNLKNRVKTIVSQEFKKFPSLAEFIDIGDLKFDREDVTEIDLQFKGNNTWLPQKYRKLVK